MENDILTRLKQSVNECTSAEKRIMIAVVGNPNQFIRKPIAEFAEDTRTSDATVIKFCKKFGCSGYKDLKLAVAMAINQLPSSKCEVAINDSSLTQTAKRIYESSLANCAQTVNQLDEQKIRASIECIQKAKKIMVLGSGYSALSANYFRLRMNGLRKLVITACESTELDYYLHQFTHDDLVIAFSQYGENRMSLNGCFLANKLNVPIIAITSQEKSSITKFANIVLLYVSNESIINPGSYETSSAQMLMVDLLCKIMMANAQSDDALDKLIE